MKYGILNLIYINNTTKLILLNLILILLNLIYIIYIYINDIMKHYTKERFGVRSKILVGYRSEKYFCWTIKIIIYN